MNLNSIIKSNEELGFGLSRYFLENNNNLWLETEYDKLRKKKSKLALPLHKLIKRLGARSWNKESLVKTLTNFVESGDLPVSELINYSGDMLSKDVMITDEGIDYFFTTITLKDWKESLRLKKSYHIFRKGYFQMMKDINLDSTDSAKIYRNYIDNSSIQAIEL